MPNELVPQYPEESVPMLGDALPPDQWPRLFDEAIRLNRRSNHEPAPGSRPARPYRRQLVIEIMDDSGSMRQKKAAAVTRASQEMIYRMQAEGDLSDSLFDLGIISFGDDAVLLSAARCVPVMQVDPDAIRFSGSSGRTNIRLALEMAEDILQRYQAEYLESVTEGVGSHPLPLVVLFSDGRNDHAYGDPCPIASRIKRMQMAGAGPMLVTVGIEYRGQPDIELLEKIASKDPESGLPLYFDIDDLQLLEQFLATLGSSRASSPAEVISAVRDLVPVGRPNR